MNEGTIIDATPNELAKIISQGLANEEQRGMILRTVQTALGSNLVKGLAQVETSMTNLNDLIARCTEHATRKVEELLTADTMDWSSALEVATTLQKNQVAFLELQRKIVQSPNKIFGDDLLSTEEKKLLTLLKSFKTQSEKEKFIKAVQKAMEDSNSFTKDSEEFSD